MGSAGEAAGAEAGRFSVAGEGGSEEPGVRKAQGGSPGSVRSREGTPVRNRGRAEEWLSLHSWLFLIFYISLETIRFITLFFYYI